MKSFNSNHLVTKTLSSLAILSAFAIASAQAVVVTWDFNPGNQNANVGSATRVYTQSGYNLTVRGYDNVIGGPDTLHELRYKNEDPHGGAFERGLGLVGTPSNEFGVNGDGTPTNYLQLDLRSVLSQGFTNGMVQVASLQSGESYTLFGSNTQGQLGTQISGTFAGLAFDNDFVAIPNFGDFQFVSIAAVSGRILPVAFQATITPIPEMNVLFPIVGLLVAVSSTQILRRRRAAQLSDPKG